MSPMGDFRPGARAALPPRAPAPFLPKVGTEMNRLLTAGSILLAIPAALSPLPLSSQVPTVEEMRARCGRAMAPGADIGDLKALRFRESNAGSAAATTWEIVRPNLVRKEREGAWVLLFDGERAGYLQGPPREDGSLEGPHLVPPEDWHHFEMDIAIHIPAFLDHPAEYRGGVSVEGRPAHVLSVRLPMGGVATYALDAESFLPLQVELPGWGFVRRLEDYREVGGFLLPHRYRDPSDASRTAVLTSLLVNPETDPARFRFPAVIR